MYRKEKRIPTILAFFILSLGIGGVVFFNQTTHQIGSKATSSIRPEDVHFTNISDSSLSVTWFTNTPATGTLIVNDHGHTVSYLEDVDSDNVLRPRNTHFVTVKNLKENTSYQIKIISGDTNCKVSENCPISTQSTASRLNTAVSLPAARGSIVTEDGKPAVNTIVYLTIGKSPPLASKTDSLGLWVITFNNLRTGDLLSRPNLADNDIVQIVAKISPDKKTEALTDVKSIRQNLTIPPLQIGKSYNLIDLISKKDMLVGLNKSNNILGTQTQIGNPNNISSSSTSKSIDILFPAYDDDTTTDNQPRFRGTGPPGNQLIITVNSAPQTARINIASDGTWSWRPTSPLAPDTHHLGISGYDDKGKLLSLTRKFIVLKSGERVLGEATASATLTPAINPSPTITLIPLPTALTPTITLIPIASPTTFPSTVSVTPRIPPKTGSIQTTLIFVGTGASLFLLGVKFLLFP